MRKESAGELTARFARWASTPIPKTPKLVQKIRNRSQLDTLEQGVRDRAKKHVEDPIRKGLTKIKADKAMGAAARPFVGKERAKAVGTKAVDFIARKPHLELAHSPISPPGTGLVAEGLERGKNRFLNMTPGLPVKTAGQTTEALKDPTVRKILALAAGVYIFKHLVDEGVAKHERQFREEQDEPGFSYRRGFDKLAKVSPYQQETQHTCSAACLKTVLEHYGASLDEHSVSKAIGVRQRGGAETDQIARAARDLGFESFEYSFDSIAQARVLTDQDIPIIADIQSFNHPGSGHYVVIHSIDDEAVHLMDPNTPGNERVISHEEMEERWWDRAMRPPHKEMPKWGVIVLPKE